MRLFAPSHPHPLRRRLWLGGSWLAIAVVTFVATVLAPHFYDDAGRLTLGGDLVPAYAAGTLVRQGRAADVYDPAALAEVERAIVRDARLEPLPLYGAYLNPPFFAAAYAPLAALPYRTAAGVWLGINLLCVAGALVLLVRMLPRGAGWRCWGLVPLLLLISMPFWQAICHLQNTCVSLLIVCGVVTCWRAAFENPRVVRWGVAAGALCGLLIYKPQLACAISLVLCLSLGWRAAAGCCATGAALVVLALVKMPGAFAAYAYHLPRAVEQIQNRPGYNWGRQVTLRGFWRLLLQGGEGGADVLAVTLLAWVGVIVGVAALGIAVWAVLRAREGVRPTDRLIAATIAAMPLLMPYYMDYDLLLLAVPAVLLAGEWLRAGRTPLRGDRQLVIVWAGLFLTLYLNPGLARPMRLNLAAVLVAAVAGATVARCVSAARARNSTMTPADPRPLAAAA